MAGVRAASVEDLYRVPGKAELVNGELVMMSPGGGTHGFIVNLPHRRSFCPDAAFWTGAPLTKKFLDGSPIFAVEVRSAEDDGPAAERAMATKRADYFAAGALVVWDVDLIAMQVHVYRSTTPASSMTCRRGELAEAEPAVPRWSMPVDDLIPPSQS